MSQGHRHGSDRQHAGSAVSQCSPTLRPLFSSWRLLLFAPVCFWGFHNCACAYIEFIQRLKSNTKYDIPLFYLESKERLYSLTGLSSILF